MSDGRFRTHAARHVDTAWANLVAQVRDAAAAGHQYFVAIIPASHDEPIGIAKGETSETLDGDPSQFFDSALRARGFPTLNEVVAEQVRAELARVTEEQLKKPIADALAWFAAETKVVSDDQAEQLFQHVDALAGRATRDVLASMARTLAENASICALAEERLASLTPSGYLALPEREADRPHFDTRRRLNRAARAIATAAGWRVVDVDFETSTNPRARQFWEAASAAYEAFFGDRPEFDEEDEDTPEEDEERARAWAAAAQDDGDAASPVLIEADRKVAFWEAVNRYAMACGGDPSFGSAIGERMQAVVSVEHELDVLREAGPRPPPPELGDFTELGGVRSQMKSSRLVLVEASERARDAVRELQDVCARESRMGWATDLRQAKRDVERIARLVAQLDDERAHAPATAPGHDPELLERVLQVVRTGTTGFWDIVSSVQEGFENLHRTPPHEAIRTALSVLVDRGLVRREERDGTGGSDVKIVHYVLVEAGQ